MNTKEFDKMAGDLFTTMKEAQIIMLLHKLNKAIDNGLYAEYNNIPYINLKQNKKPEPPSFWAFIKHVFDTAWKLDNVTYQLSKITNRKVNIFKEALIYKGQSILTQEQKDKLINFGTL